MAESNSTQRTRIVNRIDKIRKGVAQPFLTLSDREEELLERLVIAVDEYLKIVA